MYGDRHGRLVRLWSETGCDTPHGRDAATLSFNLSRRVVRVGRWGVGGILILAPAMLIGFGLTNILALAVEGESLKSILTGRVIRRVGLSRTATAPNRYLSACQRYTRPDERPGRKGNTGRPTRDKPSTRGLSSPFAVDNHTAPATPRRPRRRDRPRELRGRPRYPASPRAGTRRDGGR